MQLEHSFTVPVGIDDAWRVLLDIEQVAPCMPGAVLESVEGDDFTGSVKVKLGPISLTYKGKASFVEKDEAGHRATIDAQGRDSRGSSTAGAKVTAALTAEGDAATRVDVVTDLTITGKPAQFGRGVMEEVGNKLIGQFADCLAGKLSAGNPEASAPDAAEVEPTVPPADEHEAVEAVEAVEAAAAAEPTAAAASAPAEPAEPTVASTPKVTRIVPVPEENVEPIDLLASAGPAVAKRVIPLVAVVVLVVVVLFARRRRTTS